MKPFKKLRATAMPFPGTNVDTDQIIPARFLMKPRAGGFGQYLFHDLRFAEDGSEKPDFVLNQPAYRNAEILLGEENFGCGSSRENAVWAVSDYGFRVVIAPSFGDIFFNSSLKNGLLPIVLDAAKIAELRGQSLTMEVDLSSQTITGPQGKVYNFDIDPFSKHCLLNGIDELDYTLQQMNKIDEFERNAERLGWTTPVLDPAAVVSEV